MSTLSADTSPEIEEFQIQRLRQMPPWRKLALMADVSRTVQTLALAGLRQRFPDDTPGQRRRRLGRFVAGAGVGRPRLWSLAGGKRMLTEQIAVTLAVADVFDALGVPYAIGGSFASALHSVMRATMDVDLVADLRTEQVEPLAQALGSAFYADEETMRDAVQRHASFNLIHLETMFKVDIFVAKPLTLKGMTREHNGDD